MKTDSIVDSYITPLDAELAKAYLESHGIAVRLEGEQIAGAAFGLGTMLGGVRLFVDHDEGERARSLLAEYHERLRSPVALDDPETEVDTRTR
jgi:hypothetical protein